MRKYILSIVSLIVFSALLSGTFTGCKSEEKQSDTLDTSVVKQTLKSPQQDGEEQDMITVTGTVVDGSQNMVIIETENGESKEFNYVNDNYDPSDMYDWDLDENNKIKVTYVEGESGDSVISIQKAD
ncbi:MAG: hypothetical protein IKW83_10255 [Muribaculaceae bacterium]|nr:hypothetical protein [Muribaculaceae bacterium]